MVFVYMTITNASSDIDLIYPRLYNFSAQLAGMATAWITAIALTRLCNCAFALNARPLLRTVLLTGSFLGGLAAGHYMTFKVIGLIATSTFAKLTLSLLCNSIASLSGVFFACKG